MSFIINPYRFGAARQSLEFDGSTDYLTLSSANWGSYTRTKYAIAGSVRIDDLSDNRSIINKATGGAAGQEFRLEIKSTGELYIQSRQADFNVGEFTSTTQLSAGAWYAFLIHIDTANGTSGDRMKVWINNSAETASAYGAPTAATQSTASALNIGQWDGGDYMDGLIYSLAFFDNVLPATTDIFDGSAGKLKDLTLVSGLKSLLTGSTATDDSLLVDWTNNGTVTTSATVP